MAKPDNLENCDRIPGLRNFVNSTRGHIRQAENGPRPQADQRRDRTREREILQDLHKFTEKYQGGTITDKDLELERRLKDELNDILNRLDIDRNPPPPERLQRWRGQLQQAERRLADLMQVCAKYVAEREDVGDADRRDGQRPAAASNSPPGPATSSVDRQSRRAETPVDDTLLKAVSKITETELRHVMAHPDYGAPNARGRALVAKATEWYRHHYGDGPAATDASGKPIDRAPVRRPPAVETPLTAPDGRPVESVGADVIGSFDGLASEAGPVAAAKALQRGLNAALASAGRMAGGRAVPAFLEPLKIDGVLGNKTRSSLRAAAATVPLPSLRRGLAVGAIHGAAEDAGRGDRPRWLRAAAEMAPGGPVALQEGLNAVSRQNGGYPPLELDGWVGPKTEDRFAQTVTAAGPQAVADAFGTRLGFSYRGDDVA